MRVYIAIIESVFWLIFTYACWFLQFPFSIFLTQFLVQPEIALNDIILI